MDGTDGRFSGRGVLTAGMACVLLGLLALGTLAVIESAVFGVGLGAIVLALVLTGGLGVLIGRQRRSRSALLAGDAERSFQVASTDPLTELPNHRAFHEDLAEEMQRTARTGIPISLVMLDLNDLKAVNNAHGHQAGDEQLRALAQAITATQRATARAYRIGGDEFAV